MITITSTTFELLLVVTCLIVVIAYLNYRINRLNTKVDFLGGLTLSLIEGLELTNESQRQLVKTVEELLQQCREDAEEVPDKSEELKEGCKNVESISN